MNQIVKQYHAVALWDINVNKFISDFIPQQH